MRTCIKLKGFKKGGKFGLLKLINFEGQKIASSAYAMLSFVNMPASMIWRHDPVNPQIHWLKIPNFPTISQGGYITQGQNHIQFTEEQKDRLLTSNAIMDHLVCICKGRLGRIDFSSFQNVPNH